MWMPLLAAATASHNNKRSCILAGVWSPSLCILAFAPSSSSSSSSNLCITSAIVSFWVAKCVSVYFLLSFLVRAIFFSSLFLLLLLLLLLLVLILFPSFHFCCVKIRIWICAIVSCRCHCLVARLSLIKHVSSFVFFFSLLSFLFFVFASRGYGYVHRAQCTPHRP